MKIDVGVQTPPEAVAVDKDMQDLSEEEADKQVKEVNAGKDEKEKGAMHSGVNLLEMRSAVDLINFQLILIESKIYRDIEPVPPLSMVEFTDAVQNLDYIKNTTLPFAIGEINKICKQSKNPK